MQACAARQSGHPPEILWICTAERPWGSSLCGRAPPSRRGARGGAGGGRRESSSRPFFLNVSFAGLQSRYWAVALPALNGTGAVSIISGIACSRSLYTICRPTSVACRCSPWYSCTGEASLSALPLKPEQPLRSAAPSPPPKRSTGSFSFSFSSEWSLHLEFHLACYVARMARWRTSAVYKNAGRGEVRLCVAGDVPLGIGPICGSSSLLADRESRGCQDPPPESP